jgi:ABC-type transport system substrate-binding protein
MRGTGPFILTEYEPSVRVVYEKNPLYWRKDFPIVDRVELPILVEASQREAQFRAGRIDAGGPPPELRLQTKREIPSLQMILDPHLPFGNGPGTWMDYRPGSPWLDDRLRKGLSMLIARDLYIDTFFNVSGYSREGIDVGEMYWHSHLNSPLQEFWLDPQKPSPQGLGDAGKWWKHDVAEARKLVAATGRQLPIEAPMHKLAGNEYGGPYHENADVLANMFNEGGIFRITLNPVDYATVFTPKMSSTGNPKGGHDFEGLAFGAIGGVTGGYSDPEATWSTHFSPGGTFYKFEENFIEPRFLELNEKQSREMDEKKRIELVKETQRFLADWFPMILYPGIAKGVTLYQPWHGNAGVHITRNNETGGFNGHLRYRWVDSSKMTS